MGEGGFEIVWKLKKMRKVWRNTIIFNFCLEKAEDVGQKLKINWTNLGEKNEIKIGKHVENTDKSCQKVENKS